MPYVNIFDEGNAQERCRHDFPKKPARKANPNQVKKQKLISNRKIGIHPYQYSFYDSQITLRDVPLHGVTQEKCYSVILTPQHLQHNKSNIETL